MQIEDKRFKHGCAKLTREEAIAHGKEQLEVFGGEHREFIEMAIKALEQEPCEDCISRQAVLAIAGDSCLDLDSYEDTREFCDEINDLPPVTPQQKIGRWIDGVCSECGWDAGQEAFSEDANFCMKCGADMRGVEK